MANLISFIILIFNLCTMLSMFNKIHNFNSYDKEFHDFKWWNLHSFTCFKINSCTWTVRITSYTFVTGNTMYLGKKHHKINLNSVSNQKYNFSDKNEISKRAHTGILTKKLRTSKKKLKKWIPGCARVVDEWPEFGRN